MPLIQFLDEGQRLRMFISQCPNTILIDSTSEVYTNVSTLLHLNCHQHHASHGCLQ